MKKRLVLLFTLLVCFCASCDSGTRKLDDVANLSFEDELITFDEVEGAEYYAFDFYREGELVFQDEVDFNMYQELINLILTRRRYLEDGGYFDNRSKESSQN